MKKLTLIIAVLCATLLAGCNDEEPVYPDVSNLYGNWECVAQRTEEEHDWFLWSYEHTTFTFNPGGTMRTDGYFGYCNGRYTIEKSILNCIMDDGSNLRIRLLNANENKCEIRTTSIFGTTIIYLQRIE